MGLGTRVGVDVGLGVRVAVAVVVGVGEGVMVDVGVPFGRPGLALWTDVSTVTDVAVGAFGARLSEAANCPGASIMTRATRAPRIQIRPNSADGLSISCQPPISCYRQSLYSSATAARVYEDMRELSI